MSEMWKKAKAAQAQDMEIKYIALPSVEQVKRAQSQASSTIGDPDRSMRRYENAIWRMQFQQRKAAVIAAEIMRPQDMREPRHQYRTEVMMAREKYEQAALAVFSEVCTKGL